jgi:uncharacterized membrane protein
MTARKSLAAMLVALYAVFVFRIRLIPKIGFAYHVLDPRQARARFAIAALAVVIGALTAAREYGWVLRALSSFDAGVLTFLCFDFLIIFGSDAIETRRRAGSDDPGRTLIWVIVLLGSIVGLFAAAFVLRRAHTLAPENPGVAYALSLAAVVGSWLLTNASFTLRYAHLYFRDDGSGEGGLLFPGDEIPDAWDFAYFAFTIGMCFQVSDVVITSKPVRRTALMHSMLAFAYNTIILGMALNLFFGLLG